MTRIECKEKHFSRRSYLIELEFCLNQSCPLSSKLSMFLFGARKAIVSPSETIVISIAMARHKHNNDQRTLLRLNSSENANIIHK